MVLCLLGAFSATGMVASWSHATDTTSGSNTGYWLVGLGGKVSAGGNVNMYGSTSTLVPGNDAAGIAPTADGQGYWVVTKQGHVFAFGDAQRYGQVEGRFEPALAPAPIIGIASTPD